MRVGFLVFLLGLVLAEQRGVLQRVLVAPSHPTCLVFTADPGHEPQEQQVSIRSVDEKAFDMELRTPKDNLLAHEYDITDWDFSFLATRRGDYSLCLSIDAGKAPIEVMIYRLGPLPTASQIEKRLDAVVDDMVGFKIEQKNLLALETEMAGRLRATKSHLIAASGVTLLVIVVLAVLQTWTVKEMFTPS